MSASMTTTPIAPNIATAAPQNSDIVNASTYIFDSAEAVRVRPPKEYLFSVCTPGIIAMLTGDGSVGKSYLTLQLMVALALKDTPQLAPWCEAFGINKPRSSAFISLEDDANELHFRMQSIYNHLKLTPEDADTLGKSCTFNVLDGAGCAVNDTSWTIPLIQSLRSRHPDGLDLLVIDTLSAAHTSPEGDNTAMNIVMQAAAVLRKALGCTLLLIHHVTKDSVRKPSESSRAADSRGASSIVNRARMVIQLRPTDADGVIELTVPKINGGKRPKPQLWKAANHGVKDPYTAAVANSKATAAVVPPAAAVAPTKPAVTTTSTNGKPYNPIVRKPKNEKTGTAG